jgi:hypothetical protein
MLEEPADTLDQAIYTLAQSSAHILQSIYTLAEASDTVDSSSAEFFQPIYVL